jgi:hypothetical protein
MVKHNILVRGVNLDGSTQKTPVILQMHDDDFPARFLVDLASAGKDRISSVESVDRIPQPQKPPLLFQPVQRMMHVAMVELNCETAGLPRVDPTRVQSTGIVIRRLNRGSERGVSDSNRMSAWMRSPRGQYRWVALNRGQEDLDPEPSKRPQLQSGIPELDKQLATIALATAQTEISTPAYPAPPATCAVLGRSVVYGLVATASSEVSDASPPAAPLADQTALTQNLPALLQVGDHNSGPQFPPLASQTVDSRWMSDDFLRNQFPNDDTSVKQFQMFSTALRMLHNVFNAFDPSGATILQTLNQHNVYNVTVDLNPGQTPAASPSDSMGMGDFYSAAKTVLLDFNAYGNLSPNFPTITMPTSWDGFTQQDADDLAGKLMSALTPRAKATATPLGRYQNRNNLYCLRMFFRIKGETPNCPAELVWSQYSEPFRIAAWYESSDRPHPPVPLPDPTPDFLKNVKPNCSFHVPANLMGAMQGASMSGLMNGAAGGSSVSLDWICGFNIPLITICAFFVLNIFLMLLNIVFFWLPFIKICIPFPVQAGED